MSNTIYFFAGEMSGDMYGAALIKNLKLQLDSFESLGVGGPEMRVLGVNGSLRMEDFCVMGFSDVFLSLPRLWKQFHQIRQEILKVHPDAVVFIDSPSFSLRMAKALRLAGYKGKLIQYVCPTVWAWGKERIEAMEASFDLLLTIFPFEKKYFTQSTLPVEYVGHPLVEIIKNYHYSTYWQKLFGIKHPEHLIGLFPGSRMAEIKRNLPKQLEAAKLLQRDIPEVSLAISCAHEGVIDSIQAILRQSGMKQNKEVFFVPKYYSYDLMKSSRVAIAKSGTVALELALHQCPTVVSYELTRINRFIAKRFLKLRLDHYCIVNILAERRIFPELIEQKFSAADLYQALASLYQLGDTRRQCISDCLNIGHLLTDAPASEKAAVAIKGTLL